MKFELHTKESEGHATYPLITKNNEGGVKALTTPQTRGGYFAEYALDASFTVNADEGRVIYFALLAYLNSLSADLKPHLEDTEHALEEITFLTEQIHKVSAILYTMCEDHEDEYKKVFEAWLNV